MTSTAFKILIVDPEDIAREQLERSFDKLGFHVFATATVDSAWNIFQQHKPEYVILEIRLNEYSGIDVLREMRMFYPESQILILTAYGSIASAVACMKLGAVDYLTKPFQLKDILTSFHLLQSYSEHHAIPTKITMPSLARAEWEYIHRILESTQGNISETARRLQIHRRSLQRKLNKYPPQS